MTADNERPWETCIQAPKPVEDVVALRNALQVMVFTPAIREWLEANDPQALQQALTALTGK